MPTLSVAGALSAFSSSSLAAGTIISDTAFNVQSSIDALQPLAQSGNIASIALLDGGRPPVQITPTQATNDAQVLALISTPYSLAQVIAASGAASAGQASLASGFLGFQIADSTANILAGSNLDAIEALAERGLLSGVRLTGTSPYALQMSAATLAKDCFALSYISSPYTIQLTDAGTPAITLPVWATALDIYTKVIARITTPFTFTIAGTVQPQLITSIEAGANRYSNSTAAGTPQNPISPLGRINTYLLPGNETYFYSGLPIANALPALQAAAAAGKLVQIISYNTGIMNAVGMTAADATANATAIAEFSANIVLAQLISASQAASPPTLDTRLSHYALQDTTANILANITTVDALVRTGKVAVVTPTAEIFYWSMTAAQFAQAALTLSYSDVFTNVTIALTDGGTPTVSMAADVFSNTSVQTILGLVATPYNIAVTGVVSASEAKTIANSSLLRSLVSSVRVQDTASSIASNIGSLQTLAAAGSLASIVLSDGGVPTLGLPPAARTSDAAALGKISQPYVLTSASTPNYSVTTSNFLTNIAMFEAFAEAGTLGTVTLNDATSPPLSLSATTVKADILALAALTNATPITLTDSGTPNLGFAPWQITNAVLSKLLQIQGSFTFSVSGPINTALAAQIGFLGLGGKLSSAVAVADVQNNISRILQNAPSTNGLLTLAGLGKLGGVQLLDVSYVPNSLVLSSSTAATNASVLAAITSPYQLSMSAVSVSTALATTLPQGSFTSVNIYDSTANILANLPSLEKLAAGQIITSISLSDGTPPALTTLALTAAQAGANLDVLSLLFGRIAVSLIDAGTPVVTIQDWQFVGGSALTALGRISSNFTWQINGPIRTNRAVNLAGNSTLLSKMVPGSLIVRDSSGNIAGNLATLQTLYHAGVISGIQMSNGAVNQMALASAQITAYGTMLQAAVTTPFVYIQPVTAANAGSATLAAGYSGFVVQDSVANVLANLSTLEQLTLSGKLLSIDFTDSVPIISISAAALAANADALALSGVPPIILTDGGTPVVTISTAQLATGGVRNGVLDLIQGNWALSITGPVAASTWASVVTENNNVLAHMSGTVAIADYVVNVGQYLDQIEAGVRTGQISGVTLLDNGTPTLTVQQYQQSTDTQSLSAAISSAYTLNVVADSPACFASGTRIMTRDGPVPVEQLQVGQQAITATALQPTAEIIWLGHRRVDCRQHPRPYDVWPVRVRPDAFGAGMPAADLYLSPDHAVFVDGVLIPIRYLINGASIVQEARDSVTYWHVELAQHDVILAEGLACETYLDTGNRGSFANGGVVVAMHAEFARTVWNERACFPLVFAGPVLERARARLIARLQFLGWRVTALPDCRYVADSVTVIEPQIFDDVVCLALPTGTTRLTIMSRSTADGFLNPKSSDFRTLGVPVLSVALDGVVMSLDGDCFDGGWEVAEAEWRWTNGAGVLDVTGARIVELRLARSWIRYAVCDQGRKRA